MGSPPLISVRLACLWYKETEATVAKCPVLWVNSENALTQREGITTSPTLPVQKPAPGWGAQGRT